MLQEVGSAEGSWIIRCNSFRPAAISSLIFALVLSSILVAANRICTVVSGASVVDAFLLYATSVFLNGLVIAGTAYGLPDATGKVPKYGFDGAGVTPYRLIGAGGSSNFVGTT